MPSTLRAVSLASNQLTFVDLSPIAGCSRLESVIINGNALAELDLAPLASCEALEKLWLHQNALRSLDLSPLARCPNLRSLYLDGNKIDANSLDLTPLENCKQLRSLRLGRNRLGDQLDITPILSCASLSSLDVSASVRLVARLSSSQLSAQSASASLPPALRRKAASVIWKTVSDEEDGESEGLSSGSSDESDEADVTKWPQYEEPTCPRRPSPLDELRELAIVRKTSGAYTALMLGFQGSIQYSIQSLLKEHGNIKCVCIPSLTPEVSPTTLVSAGAFKKCQVILLRPQNESMILGFRTLDAHMPIIVVGSANSATENAKRCLLKGATTFLPEPLSARDALTIRVHAQRRARSTSMLSRKRSPKTSPDPVRYDTGFVMKLDVGAVDGELPTSPVTSSESSPPSGVPTVPFDLQLDEVIKERVPQSQQGSRGEGKERACEKRAKKELPALKKLIRSRNERSIHFRARVECSGINMVFSRCGGSAHRENFHGVATICGLPMCVGHMLYDAVKNWTSKMDSIGQLCAPRQITKHASMPELSLHHGFSSTRRLAPSLKRRNSAPPDMANVVTYEHFVQFWEKNLRQHDCEHRLFTVTSIANQFAPSVPLDAVSQLACNFIVRRSSSVEDFSGTENADRLCAAKLAAKVVRYELHGNRRQRLSAGELMRSNLCASFIAAESGIYNGVTAHLRTDRLRSIYAAYEEACASVQCGELTVTAVTAFCAERGLLTPRSVRALFERYVSGSCMTVQEFAPMWLAANDLTTKAASSYLFDVIDVDQDGYIGAVDVAHFYSEKCTMLLNMGYVPVLFEHIWHSILDNLSHGRSLSAHGRRQLSLTELHKVSERDRVTFWQSVLFVEDELAVDCYRTAAVGGANAANVVRATF